MVPVARQAQVPTVTGNCPEAIDLVTKCDYRRHSCRSSNRLNWPRPRRMAATIRDMQIRVICTPVSSVGKAT